MCGIAGFVNQSGKYSPSAVKTIAKAIADLMPYRGPDDSGVWVDPTGYCGLSQRRLSIVDLTNGGHQPMLSADGKTCITYNGEFYSFPEIKSELEKKGIQFRTQSDTEVLIEGLRNYGDQLYSKIDAMYAFGFYDTEKKELTLARDPFGKKPLYYVQGPGYFAFSSELHTLTAIPGFDSTIDEEAISEYFLFQYIQAPRTIYRSVKKLMPGHFLKLSSKGEIRTEQFFKFNPYGVSPEKRSLDDLADELGEILTASVKRRLMSDVPLGAFLSGGVDSSVVVAIMKKALNRDVKTFSIGFEGTDETEHLFARQIAEHLGTEHHEKLLKPDVFSLAAHIGKVLDEPNGDTSCLPTFLLSEFTRKHVTVALSGDGGDEMFGGYGRYLATLDENERTLRGDPGFASWTPGGVYFGNRVLLFSEDDLRFVIDRIPPETAARMRKLRQELNHPSKPLIHRMREIDAETYMPGAVLPKVDRMSMQHSLEVRCPLLSIHVARFAEKLGPEALYQNGQGKLVLKQLGSRYIPMEWLARKKMGFGLPMNLWGRDELLKALKTLTLGENGKLFQHIGRAGMERFVNKQSNPNTFSTYQVWGVLMLEIWLQNHPSRVGKSFQSRPWNRLRSSIRTLSELISGSHGC